MSETNASLQFDEPIEGPVTAPASGEALTRSTSNSPVTAVTRPADDSGVKTGGFQPGMQIGVYQLISKLGEGGMGIVFKARHTRLDKIVAIKLLPSAYLTHPSTLARFELEMKVVGRLEHPNIVGAYDAGEEKGTHYLVMEFVEGTDLQRLVILRGKLSVENACKAVYQSAIGLQAAHDAGVIHRDIKPSNLFVTKDGKIKILDLGLARLSQDEGEGITKSGQVFGTPEYMAPEQWDDVHGCDGRTDLYALGCTLFFLLTGQPPYGGDEYKTAPRKMLGHINDPVPSLKARRGDVPDELDAIYFKLMAKSAKDRFANAQELAEALSPWVLHESKLTQLPLSSASIAKNPSGSTIHDRTHVDHSQSPVSAAATHASASRDAEAQTLLDPLSHTGTTVPVIAVVPVKRPAGTRSWVIAGGVLVTSIVTGAAIYFGGGRSAPSTTVDAGSPEPAIQAEMMETSAFPEVVLNHLLPSTGHSYQRGSTGRDHAWELSAPIVIERPEMLMDQVIPTGMTGGADFLMSPHVLAGESQLALVPAPVFPEPEEIDLGPQRLSAPFDTAKFQAAQKAWAIERNVPEDQWETTNSIGMALVFIPPGEFDMGSSRQLHRVKIPQTFYVGKFEVTQGEYKAVIGKNPSRFSPTGPKLFQPKIKGLKTDRLPVDSISWEEAIDYCNELSLKEGLVPYYSGARKVIDPDGTGYRLLTEAEWEYVCRAGTDTLYSYGQKLTGADANIKDPTGVNLARTQEVGRYEANQFGLHDLHGNVMEWCFDAISLKGIPKYRALRGGSWNRTAKDSNAHDHALLESAQNQNDTGFRVARTVRPVQMPVEKP